MSELPRNSGELKPDVGSESSDELGADSRYPYTYAADFLRMKIGDDYGKGLISRAAAAQAKTVIANVLGLDEREIACKLADAYLKDQRA